MNLITGASGLVGSHLLYKLLTNGHNVRALIRSEKSKNQIEKIFGYYTDNPDQYLSKISWVFGDITNYSVLNKAFIGVSTIYHCAAFISFSERDFSKMKEVNIEGTANVVNLCLEHAVKKLMHVSSIAAIGDPVEGHSYDEDCGWPQGKISSYAFTKTQSEMEVWRGIAEGLDAVIVNPAVILGPGNWYSGSSKLFNQIYKGMKFYTKGVTGFVDVRDVVDAMVLLMNAKTSCERYILNGENQSYKEVCKSIAEALQVSPPRIYAKPLFTSLAWRLGKLLLFLSGRQPILTKDTAKAAHKIQRYSSKKIKLEHHYSFQTIDDIISRTAKIFLAKNRRC